MTKIENEIEEIRKNVADILGIKNEEEAKEYFNRLRENPDFDQISNIHNKLSPEMKNKVFDLGKRYITGGHYLNKRNMDDET